MASARNVLSAVSVTRQGLHDPSENFPIGVTKGTIRSSAFPVIRDERVPRIGGIGQRSCRLSVGCADFSLR